jgi:hypothetical protein
MKVMVLVGQDWALAAVDSNKPAMANMARANFIELSPKLL